MWACIIFCFSHSMQKTIGLGPMYILFSYIPLIASFIGLILWIILSTKKKTNFESDSLGVLLPLVMASAYVTNNNSIGYSNLATIAVGIFIPVYFLGEAFNLYHRKNKK